MFFLRRLRPVVSSLSLLGLGALSSLANPTGGHVAAGAATIAGGAGGLTITQTSGRAVINWQDFSIGAGELVRFVQPDALSATLNRVVSGAPSSLLGDLQANGRVYLINPNGILVGAGARIDTGGFLASTLDANDGEFLRGGDLLFRGDSAAAVQNLGAINALGGDVFLIARKVENRGTINAANGTAGLAAGSEVLLTTGGSERVFVQAVSSPGQVENAGTIAAATAELKAAGGNAYALAINNPGIVRATGSAVRDGQVWLVGTGGAVVSSGTFAAASADGTRGGVVRILGDAVTVAGNAVVDVSGTQTGGTALIGGDFQGKNPDVPNATTTSVASGATISARGADRGGRVILWSDERTDFAGVIGAQGARGGFVEVSGKDALRFTGQVDTAGGTLLLDPANITVQVTAGDQVNTFDTAQITTLLGANDLTLAADTDITWNAGAALDYNGIGNSGRTLTLQAGNNISYAGTISDSVAGGDLLHVVFNSDRDASGAGGIAFSAGSSITSNGGNITLGGGADPATAGARGSTRGVDLVDTTLNSGTGAISIRGTASAVAGNNNFGINVSGGSILAGGAGAITLSGTGATSSGHTNFGVGINDDAVVQSTGSGGITISGTGGGAAGSYYNDGVAIHWGGSVTSATGPIAITGTGGVVTGGNPSNGISFQGVAGKVESTGSAAITLAGTGTGAASTGIYLGNATTIGGAAATGDIALKADAMDFSSGTIQGTGALAIEPLANNTTIGLGDGATGALNLTAAELNRLADGFSSITIGRSDGTLGIDVRTLAFMDPLTLRVPNGFGNITLNGALSTGSGSQAGSVTLQAGNDITLAAGGSITTQGEAITLNSNRDASGLGTISLSTPTSIITSNGGAITLGGGANPATTPATMTSPGTAGVTIAAGTISSGAGAITIAGTADRLSGVGVRISSGGKVLSTSGDIAITGIGGGGGSGNIGVLVGASGTVQTTGGGNITLTGQGSLAGTGTDNEGVRVTESLVEIQTGTNRTLTINGTAGGGTDKNIGVSARFDGVVRLGSTVTGEMNVTGTGKGSAGGTGNWGVLAESGIYESLGAGAITMTGTGGLGADNHGIKVTTGASNWIGSTTMSGDITLTADMIDLQGSTGIISVRSTGDLLIQPKTVATTLGVGDSAVGTLNLNAMELGRLFNGFSSITIGHASGSGAIDVRTHAFHEPLTIRSPVGAANLTVNGALSTGSGTSAGSITLQAGNNITLAASSSVVTSGEAVVLNSDRDATGSGAISLGNIAKVETSGGDITLRGGSATLGALPDPTDDHDGFLFSPGLQFTSARGDGPETHGVSLSGADLNAGGGNIHVRGIGAAGFDGLFAENSMIRTSGSGSISLFGAGGGTGSGNDGIYMVGSWASADAGNITAWGLGRGVNTGRGVWLEGTETAASLSTTDGMIDVRGASRASGTSNQGVRVENGAYLESYGNGAIDVVGRGYGTGADNNGIHVLNGSSIRTPGEGGISLTGFGSTNGAANNNEGIEISSSSLVEVTGGSADLNVTGTGGNGTSWNIGVNVGNSTLRMGDVAAGSLNVTGVGGGATSGNWGVLTEANGKIESRGGSAIFVTGTGGGGSDNHGIRVTSGDSNFIGSSLMSGSITLTADSMDLEGAGTLTVQSTGDLLIQPLSAPTTMGLGDGASGTLTLNATELSRLADGFSSITIGRANSTGAVDVRTAEFHDPLTIRTPLGAGVIAVNTALSTGSDSSAGSITLQAGANVTLAASATLSTEGEVILVSADADESGAGFISLGENSAIASGGGSITLGGGANPASGFAVSTTANQSGVQLDAGATITSGDAAIIINGRTGTAEPDFELPLLSFSASKKNARVMAILPPAGVNAGILLAANSLIDSGEGTLALTGQSVSTTTDNFSAGIIIKGGGLTTTTGAITLTGTSTAASTTGARGIELSGVDAGSKAITTTTGAINLTGTASTNGGAGGTHYGVSLHDGFTVGTTDGAIAITGTGRGAGESNHGIAVDGSTLQVTGTGTLTLNGTGGAGAGKINHGLFFDNAAAITVANAAVSLTGTTASAGNGLNSGAGGATLSANGSGVMTLTATSNGGSLATAKVTGDLLRLDGAGDFTLTHAQNDIGTVAGSLAGSLNLINNAALIIGTVSGVTGVDVGAHTVTVQTLVGNLTLASGADVVATGAVATPLVLATAANFINSAGAAALDAGDGRWLVWSTNPANNTRGALPADFKQYGATYGVTAVAQAGGNGFLYTLAPILTPSLQGAITRVYDGTTAATITAANVTGSGAVDSDVVTFAATGATYDTKNVGTTKTVTATGISIASVANGTETVYGYQLGSTTASAAIGTITPATLTYVASAVGRTYGASNPTFTGTVTGFVNSETVAGATTGTLAFGSAATTTSNVGSYLVSGSGLTANNGNYTFVQHAGNATALTINAATLTYVADTASRTYGATNPTFTGTVTGFVNSETLAGATTGTLAFGSAAMTTSNVGSYLVSGSGLSANNGNYTFAQHAGNATALSITPATLTYVAGAVSRTYGASNPTFTGTVSGFVNSETLAGATTGTLAFGSTATTTSNVGSYLVSGSGLTANNGNYTFTQHAGNATALTINPATLTYVADAVSRTYGASNPTFTGTVTGFVNSETLAGATTGTLAFGSAATTTSNVGSYLVSGSGLTANNGNYTFVQHAGNATALTINPATLTYVADTASRTYGASNPTFTGTVTGFVNSETLAGATTGTLAFGSAATTTSNVGSYLVSGSGLTANNGNYTFTQHAGNATALTINPATLTYVADAVSRTYGASNPAFTGTITGFVNSETLAGATTGTLAFGSTATTTSNVGSYLLSGSGLSANNGNYTFAQHAGNATALTINAATLTYVADAVSRTYGASNPTFTGTVTGFVNSETLAGATTGTLAFGSTATTTSNVGSYLLSGSGLSANNGNYTFAQHAGNATALTINPATLTYVADAVSRTYGASNPTLTGTVTGFVNSETLAGATTGTLAFGSAATTTSNVGSYLLSGSGLSANNGNYTFAQHAGNATALTINPATLTYVADAVSRTYGASNPTFTGTVTGFVNSETLGTATTGMLTFGSTATSTSNVGSYLVSGSGLSANNGNYTFAQHAGNATALSITPATLTYVADAVSRTYGASNPTFTGTVTGFVNGETLAGATTGTLAFGGTALATSNVGAYAVNGAGLAANHGNYAFGQHAGNASALTITPAPLTITANSHTKVYGAALPTFTATYQGFVLGHDSTALGGTLVLGHAASTASDVGSYPITPSGQTSSNYAITYVPGSLAITPAPLAVTANDAVRLYGAANPTFGATYVGFVLGQNAGVLGGALVFNTSAGVTSNVGSYAVTPSGLSSSNYTLTFAAGNLLVNQAPLTITADSAARLYGDANPTFGATFAGLLNGESSSVVSGLTFATPATAASDVGSYAITLSGGAAQNYALSYVNGTLSVTPAPLTITAENAARLYGSANPAFTATYAGFRNADTAAVVSGLTLSTAATAASDVGSYAVVAAGAAASNYAITFGNGTLSVNPAPLTVRANSTSRLFGTANPDFSATYAGFVLGHDTSVLGGTLAFSTPASLGSPIGSYAITPGGLTASNYAITFGDGVLAVGQALLTVRADDFTKVYGVALPAFTASYSGFAAGDTPASSLTGALTFTTTANAGSNVGTYSITPGGVASANYALVFEPGTLTISPAALTLTANSATRVYGAANPAFGVSYAGFVNGDTAAALGGTATFATPATTASGVGTYAVTPGGVTAGNYAITFVPGQLAITPAPLSITAQNAARTYGAANPGFSATFGGLVNGDSSSVVTGLQFATSATPSSGVGSYAITPSGGTAANYTLSFVNGTLTIDRAPLTVTANDAAREFGLPNPAFTATLSGLVNGDAPTVINGLIFNTPATAGSAAGTYGITPLGATAANYALAFVNGTLTVTAPTVVIDDTPASVPTIGNVPVLTDQFAVVVFGNRFVLVPITTQGDGTPAIATDGGTNSVDRVLTSTLASAGNPPSDLGGGRTESGGTINTPTMGGGLNLSGFEIVAVLSGGPGGSAGSAPGVISPSQANDPGLFRESSVNMGRFNVIYREVIAEARELAEGNTALGSSYREFLDTETPQVILLRAAPGTRPNDDAAAPAANNPGATD